MKSPTDKRPQDFIRTQADLNRHGTFLSAKVHESDDVFAQLNNLLKAELTNPPADTVRVEILQKLMSDLSHDSFTKNLQEEGAEVKFAISQQEIDWLQKAPQDKWVDYLVYRYEFKIYPRIKKLRPFPIYLLIEPTSVCNLRCVMCFQVDRTFTKKEFMGRMPWEMFERVVDQAKAGGTQAITLASRGEPTLHPQFGKMLRYLSDKGFLDVKINTNAMRLTEALIHDVLGAGVNEVVFSVDAGTKDTYESIRVNGKFESVVSNIEMLNDIRAKKYPNSPTVTRISGVKVRDDQDEKQMSEFWSERVDQVTIKRATPRWDSYNNALMDIGHPCSMLWDRMYVWYDGKVNPCDFDYKSNLCVGDVNTTPIEKIWLGEPYQKLREDHLNKQRKAHNPCDRCPLY